MRITLFFTGYGISIYLTRRLIGSIVNDTLFQKLTWIPSKVQSSMTDNLFIRSSIRKVITVTYKIPYDIKYNI